MLADLLDDFESTSEVRPCPNVGCLLDIPTGTYSPGLKGESLLTGGLAYLTGIGGRGNSFKSVLERFFILRVLERYSQTVALEYDTEVSATYLRMQQLAEENAPKLAALGVKASKRYLLTDKTIEDGTSFYAKIKKLAHKRIDQKNAEEETPFINTQNNEHIKLLMPIVGGVDSLSMFASASVIAQQEKNEIGESGRNTEALRDAMAKNQMLMELPTLTAQAGLYMLFTAHMGDEHQLDPYAPPAKKLHFLKGKVKFKNVPEKFTFLMNNCWYVTNHGPVINDSTKAPEFPRDSDDNLKGDTDLTRISIMNLRGKSGPTGLPIELIVSQSEGILVGLSEFWYIRQHNRFGLGGNLQNYFLELCPDVSLSRTTIRRKIKEHEKLRRALEITSEMCQIQKVWHHVEDKYLCTPKELYDDLIKLGYDWDRLLNTRGYWTFDQYENEIPYLSTMDLMKMRVGEYRPYWYDK